MAPYDGAPNVRKGLGWINMRKVFIGQLDPDLEAHDLKQWGSGHGLDTNNVWMPRQQVGPPFCQEVLMY